MSWLKELLSKNKEIKNVHYIGGVDWPVNKIFEHAIKARLESVTVIGWLDDGSMYVNSSHAKRGDLYWDLSVAAKEVIGK